MFVDFSKCEMCAYYGTEGVSTKPAQHNIQTLLLCNINMVHKHKFSSTNYAATMHTLSQSLQIKHKVPKQILTTIQTYSGPQHMSHMS